MAKMTIRQWPSPLEVRGTTLLDTALKAGIPYPHGCRTGECGSCKTRLLSGSVKMDPYDVAVLTPAEKAAGVILACRARPTTDVEVAWIAEAPAFPVVRITGRVMEIMAATHDVRIVRVEPDAPFGFTAGQFARVSFAKLPARPYSMANRPDEAVLEFHIRLVPGGVASEHVQERLRPGDRIALEGPFGDAYLRDPGPRPIVAVAGGTGFAPIRSIIRTALDRRGGGPIHVYLGFRDERDVYGENDLSMWMAADRKLNGDVVLSQPSNRTQRRTGFVHEAIMEDFDDLRGAQIYVCGPSPMVTAVQAVAAGLGVPPDYIHADPFTPAAEFQEPSRLFARVSRLLHR
jgi:ferredoxin-NAD(P)+ reductase (naphthalene dioxygenase ferredoxin-specific)